MKDRPEQIPAGLSSFLLTGAFCAGFLCIRDTEGSSHLRPEAAGVLF